MKFRLFTRDLLALTFFFRLFLLENVRAAGNLTNIVGSSTNGPAVYSLVRVPATTQPIAVESGTVPQLGQATNPVFDHFLPGSLNNLVWTNFIAHTNGRDMTIWSTRSHPLDWPAHPPTVSWNANSLIWGMKGLSAL